MNQTTESIEGLLLTRLSGITKAAGFKTDIGSAAFAGRQNLTGDNAPCCTVIVGDDETNGQRGTLANVLQKFLLIGQDECDDIDNPNEKAHDIDADLKRAVFRDGNDLGGKVKSVEYLGHTYAPRADGSKLVSVGVEIRVQYVEELARLP